MLTEEQVREKYQPLKLVLNERQIRIWAATEAQSLGRGGVSIVSRATGIARHRIARGIDELRDGENLDIGRVRREGAGRRPLTEVDPTLLKDLESLVDPLTRGDPESALRWTCKSGEKLAEALRAMGHKVCGRTVDTLLVEQLHYQLNANAKMLEGTEHPDRNAQFEHINAQAEDFQTRGQPVISVDTKKKELVGEYKNGGREWEPAGHPTQVSTHDFPDPKVGKAVPYGVYDIGKNNGFVSVGTDHDTAAFAVDSILGWWRTMGERTYPDAKELMITADGGGSNGYRSRLWKVQLQRLADTIKRPIHVCHFPPGTSKWNKIEHRMFSFISINWRGRPLTTHEVIVNLIGQTRTKPGLHIAAELNTNHYPIGIKVSDELLQSVNLHRDSFHGEWNYTILPMQ
jgi:hypothetical protein